MKPLVKLLVMILVTLALAVPALAQSEVPPDVVVVEAPASGRDLLFNIGVVVIALAAMYFVNQHKKEVARLVPNEAVQEIVRSTATAVTTPLIAMLEARAAATPDPMDDEQVAYLKRDLQLFIANLFRQEVEAAKEQIAGGGSQPHR